MMKDIDLASETLQINQDNDLHIASGRSSEDDRDAASYTEEDESSDDRDHDLQDASVEDVSLVDASVQKRSKGPVFRGLTRLPRIGRDYEHSGGRKRIITFDEQGKFLGEYKSEFVSYMGDRVRYNVGLRFLSWKSVPKETKDAIWVEITKFYEVDACRRRQIMTRLGCLLRNFRRKMYEGHILPNLNKPKKLAKVTRQYSTFVNQDDWNNFVAYTQSEEFKELSINAKKARAKNPYDHHLGRGGYTYPKDKLLRENELAIDEVPSRALMWRKARKNKQGEFKNDEVKAISEKIKHNETQIQQGALTLEPGMDALIEVFGMEKGGFVKGVGYGLTKSKYWPGCQAKNDRSADKQIIEHLKGQLENERIANLKKDAHLKDLSARMTETQNQFAEVLACLKQKGITLSKPNDIPSPAQPANVSVDTPEDVERQGITPMSKNIKHVQKEKQKTIKLVNKRNKNLVTSSDVRKPDFEETCSTDHPDTTNIPLQAEEGVNTYKCKLYHLTMRNIVAMGTVHVHEDQTKVMIVHGVPVQKDDLKVSVDTAEKPCAFLPIPTKEATTVEEALGGFVACQKDYSTVPSYSGHPVYLFPFGWELLCSEFY